MQKQARWFLPARWSAPAPFKTHINLFWHFFTRKAPSANERRHSPAVNHFRRRCAGTTLVYIVAEAVREAYPFIPCNVVYHHDSDFTVHGSINSFAWFTFTTFVNVQTNTRTCQLRRAFLSTTRCWFCESPPQENLWFSEIQIRYCTKYERSDFSKWNRDKNRKLQNLGWKLMEKNPTPCGSYT